MAELPPWRAIQPPKIPRFTGEADCCDADEFIQEAERILRNFRVEDGTAVEWLIQALEGSARREVLTRAAGEADTAAEVGSPRSNLRRPPGPLCSAHFVPRPAAGNGGECSGARAAPADADHQAERSAGGRRQPRYALQPFHRRAAPPSLRRDIRRYAREHADVTFHQTRAGAQRWMRENADVEVRADADVEVRADADVEVAQPQHSKEVEELRAQVAALTAKTAELQAELRHQSTRAQRCEQPGHFQQDCAERRQYVQRQQAPRASFNPSRPQPRFYAPWHSAGPRFPSHQGN